MHNDDQLPMTGPPSTDNGQPSPYPLPRGAAVLLMAGIIAGTVTASEPHHWNESVPDRHSNQDVLIANTTAITKRAAILPVVPVMIDPLGFPFVPYVPPRVTVPPPPLQPDDCPLHPLNPGWWWWWM